MSIGVCVVKSEEGIFGVDLQGIVKGLNKAFQYISNPVIIPDMGMEDDLLIVNTQGLDVSLHRLLYMIYSELVKLILLEIIEPYKDYYAQDIQRMTHSRCMARIKHLEYRIALHQVSITMNDEEYLLYLLGEEDNKYLLNPLGEGE